MTMGQNLSSRFQPTSSLLVFRSSTAPAFGRLSSIAAHLAAALKQIRKIGGE